MKKNYDKYLMRRNKSSIKDLLAKVIIKVNSSFNFSYKLRNIAYRWVGVNMPDDMSGVFIARDVLLDDNFPELIYLEEGIVLSWRVILICHDATNEQKRIVAPIHIKKKAVIGAGSIVLPGVTIGEKAIVGAGSVVTKDVPPYTVVAGCPARVLRHLDE